MSNLSLKAAVKEDKFNLKVIFTLFFLIDLFLYPIFADRLLEFFYLVMFQLSLLVSLLYGLRGQGKYKNVMISLQSIARNRDMDVDERESRLVSMIHHACLELGFVYEERNEEYGLFKFTKKNVTKKTKIIKNDNNVKGGCKKLSLLGSLLVIDEVVLKQIGYMVVGIWGVFSPVIAMLLAELNFHWALILFLTGTWVFVDIFILFYIHYIFKIEPIVGSLVEAENTT